jgi:hypothetical protein
LSYHDAQLQKLQNITAPILEFTSCYARSTNSFTVDEFQSKLSTESWDDIFEGSDTNVTFNNFLNIHLKMFMHVSLHVNLIPHTDITHE